LLTSFKYRIVVCFFSCENKKSSMTVNDHDARFSFKPLQYAAFIGRRVPLLRLLRRFRFSGLATKEPMHSAVMSHASKRPKVVNQDQPGRSSSSSIPSASGKLFEATKLSLAFSRFRRAASVAAYMPVSRFLERNDRFTLDRVDFAMANLKRWEGEFGGLKKLRAVDGGGCSQKGYRVTKEKGAVQVCTATFASLRVRDLRKNSPEPSTGLGTRQGLVPSS
jgi:hypothetical protein